MVQRSILISSLSSLKFAIIGCTGHDKVKFQNMKYKSRLYDFEVHILYVDI